MEMNREDVYSPLDGRWWCLATADTRLLPASARIGYLSYFRWWRSTCQPHVVDMLVCLNESLMIGFTCVKGVSLERGYYFCGICIVAILAMCALQAVRLSITYDLSASYGVAGI